MIIVGFLKESKKAIFIISYKVIFTKEKTKRGKEPLNKLIIILCSQWYDNRQQNDLCKSANMHWKPPIKQIQFHSIPMPLITSDL